MFVVRRVLCCIAVEAWLSIGLITETESLCFMHPRNKNKSPTVKLQKMPVRARESISGDPVCQHSRVKFFHQIRNP